MLQLVKSLKSKWHIAYKRVSNILKHEIWKTDHHDQGLAKRVLFYLLRIASLVNDGFNKNNVFVRGASLSYSSLLSLGPLAAMVMLVAGFLLDSIEEDKLIHTMEVTVEWVAAPLAEFLATNTEGNEEGQFYKEAISKVNSFINNAKSSAAGVIGLLFLGLIAIQLFTAVEKSFNDIWGVRRGRSWIDRLFFYFGSLTLCAFLGFLSLAIYSAGRVAQFVQNLPFGEHILSLTILMAPLLSFVLILILLTIFYKSIPNTQVNLGAALTGAIVVSLLLLVNNKLSMLYIQKAVTAQSLYGSLGIITILMFALYIFWVFVLIGGQITYAIQNANFLANQEVWNNISPSTRQILGLATLVFISRRFMECKPAFTGVELGQKLHVPGKVLNETLIRLIDMGFVSEVMAANQKGFSSKCFQPAKPLAKMTLYKFKKAFEDLGNSTGKELILKTDPIIKQFTESLENNYKENWDSVSLEELLIKSQANA